VGRSVVNYLIFLAKRTNQEIQYQQLVLSIWLPTFASHYSGLATSRLTARNGKVGLYMCTAQHMAATLFSASPSRKRNLFGYFYQPMPSVFIWYL